MAKMQPFVWLYCQNSEVNMTALAPLVSGGGEMVHLDNVGREGHAYLQVTPCTHAPQKCLVSPLPCLTMFLVAAVDLCHGSGTQQMALVCHKI